MEHGDIGCQFGEGYMVTFFNVFLAKLFDNAEETLISIGIKSSPNNSS